MDNTENYEENTNNELEQKLIKNEESKLESEMEMKDNKKSLFEKKMYR